MALRIAHTARHDDALYQVDVTDGSKYPLIKIGRHSYGHEFFVHWEGEPCQIYIGRYCSIAHGVRFFAGQEHHTEWGTTYPFSHLPREWSECRAITGHPATRGNIIAENDVWIGYGALIRSGVTIGNGAVVGMGAVVTHSVPPYAIVAGNPARIVRYRFEQEVIERLQKIEWWTWPEDQIRTAAPILCKPLTIEILKSIEEM